MTDELRALMDEWRQKNTAFLEACAECSKAFDADPTSETVTILDDAAGAACRAVNAPTIALLAFPAIEPDDVRAKARWIVKEFEDCIGFTDEQAEALMASWRATAET